MATPRSNESRLRRCRDRWKLKAAAEQMHREAAEGALAETQVKLSAAFGNLGRAHMRFLFATGAVILMIGVYAGQLARPTSQPVSQPDSRFCADEYTPPHIMASVRIANGGCRCSGAIISKGKNWGAGTSAAHCFKGVIGGKFWVNHPDGRTSEATLLAIDKEHDLALWKIPAEDVKWHTWVPRSWDEVSEESNQYEAVGYTSARGPEYKRVKPDNSVNIVNGDLYRVVEGDFGPGDSGGNVFLNGALVSVISASESNQTPRTNEFIHGCDLASLVSFLDANDKVFCDDDCGPWGCKRNRQQKPKPKPPEWKPDPNIPIIPPPEEPAPGPPPEDSTTPPPPVIPQLPPETTERINQLEQKIETVVKQVNEIKITSPVPGPAGRDGKDGQPGQNGVVDYDRIEKEIAVLVRERIDALVASGEIKGKDGTSPTIDVDAITKQVLEKLPPIEVRNDNSLESIDQTVKLGGVLRVPPVRFSLQEKGDDPMKRSKPLGESFLLQAIPYEKK